MFETMRHLDWEKPPLPSSRLEVLGEIEKRISDLCTGISEEIIKKYLDKEGIENGHYWGSDDLELFKKQAKDAISTLERIFSSEAITAPAPFRHFSKSEGYIFHPKSDYFCKYSNMNVAKRGNLIPKDILKKV